MALKLAEMILKAAGENPDLVKVPMASVQGNGSSLEDEAAVLSSQSLLGGNRTIAKTLKQELMQTAQSLEYDGFKAACSL